MVDAATAFNYAAWQNAVPLLRRIEVSNPTDAELTALTIELQPSPAFLRAKRWTLDRVPAGQMTSLRDIDVEVDPEFLDRLDESERGLLTFRLIASGQVLCESTHELRILARDEWGGLGSMGELLAAFVTPNDPAVPPLLKSAAMLLEAEGYSSALDGYQSCDPRRVYLLAAALWSVIASKSITYANPPASFERTGQKVRRVGTVLSDGLATCLDSTLLFASLLEGAGLNPVVVITEGHCFIGAWLVEKTFTHPVETDSAELRKAVTGSELIVFESTLITHRPPGDFSAAVSTATAATHIDREHEFHAAIDIRRGRMLQIRPLATRGERSESNAPVEEAKPLPLPIPPSFGRLVIEAGEELPKTPAGRIERWQRKLLDLSLRNRLLNFRMTRQTVPILCPNLSKLEDHLANGDRIRLISLPSANPVGSRDPELHLRRTSQDLDREFSIKALERKELACTPVEAELTTRLTALYRQVRNDLAEGGSNTLYLAIGFLRWKQRPTDSITYRAPLLLVPVTLVRRSASSPFYLASHEDEVRFNATLLQLLKKDFGCDLSRFETDLPTDDSGVDVPLILERMRLAVREIAGFEVLEEAAIASFSFAKYLMWRDLMDRVGQLEHNRVVRHLIHSPDKLFSSGAARPAPRPRDIDTRYSPADLVHPLPADSSQLAAVMAAAEGHDLVIVGPPGTGKSQTIANLIAQCLSSGKTVLFVAEKTAALDVVHRRLKHHGLGDCCVELHSNKAERRRFLDQLEAAWKNRREPQDTDWIEINERLRMRRDQLNEYAAALHTPASNGWTAYRAMGECVRGRAVATPELNWSNTVEHDRVAYQQLEAAISQLASTFKVLGTAAPPLRVRVREWSMKWETDLLDICGQLAMAASSLLAAYERLCQLLSLPGTQPLNGASLQQFYKLARELIQPNLPPAELVLYPQLEGLSSALGQRTGVLATRQGLRNDRQRLLADVIRLLGAAAAPPPAEPLSETFLAMLNELARTDRPPTALAFHPRLDSIPTNLGQRNELKAARDRARESLTARSYSLALLDRIPVEEILDQWTVANRSFWPLASLKKNAVKNRLQAFVKPPGRAAPEIDVSLLVEYRESADRLANSLAELELPPSLQSLIDSNPQEVDTVLASARALRSATVSAGFSADAAHAASGGALDPLVSTAKQLLTCLAELASLEHRLQSQLDSLALPGTLAESVRNNGSALNAQLPKCQSLRDATATALGDNRDHRAVALRGALAVPPQERVDVATAFCKSANAFHTAWKSYLTLAEQTAAEPNSPTLVADTAATANEIVARRHELKLWIAWRAAQDVATEAGLSQFVKALESKELEASTAVAIFRLAYARWWLPRMVDQVPALRSFQRFLHEAAIEDFQQLDEAARQAAAPRVRQAVCHQLPAMSEVPKDSELGKLRHQLGLKQPSRSIREIVQNLKSTFPQLAPCMLMSPLSIAQYLPVDYPPFDVVIFDEASQIATWDAIGAVARGRQTIIVGDPKQLPPTNFFGKTNDEEDNPDLEDHEKDLESILDEAAASGLPVLQLNWHYRSRHESLIHFSNQNYYGNQLITFPAAESIDRGVSFWLVSEGVYDRGKSRTNQLEAEAIVADAVTRMQRCLRKPPSRRLTYGVVTFNSQQQERIQDLFDAALRQHPELEWFFSDERIEPTVVKNLENVQGDERDVMLFSITFGFDAARKFPVDFGAINRVGGERRLNVAVTRARRELVVFCSFQPDQLRAERSTARGVHDLKSFLLYSQRGPEALIAHSDGSQGETESPFEDAVCAALKSRGWQVDTQVGISGFRIDLGIVHPERPGAYLAGIECDGATYHRAAAARDRDKTRQQILEGLGWKILRIWSTDWWYAPDTALEAIDHQLRELLAASWATESLEPAEPETETSSTEPTPQEASSLKAPDLNAFPVETLELTAPRSGDLPPLLAESLAALTEQPNSSSEIDVAPFSRPASFDGRSLGLARELAGQQSLLSEQRQQLPLQPPNWSARQPAERRYFQRSDPGDRTADQHRFFDDDYTETLRAMAQAVVTAQGPIRLDAVTREVARAHGFARTGGRIAQRVQDLVTMVTSTEETVGRFLWPGAVPLNSVPFRYAKSEGDRRPLDEIAMPELVGLIQERPELVQSDDPAIAIAREIGLARLSKNARDRLEDAIEVANGLAIDPEESDNR